MAEEYINDVCKIIQTGSDSIDWEIALHLVDILIKDRKYDHQIFQAIYDLAISGDRKIKLNSISFIDSLFKNGNQELLTALQCSPSILGIADDPIVSDPYVHRILCASAEEWVSICKEKHCLMGPFLQWQTRLFSFKYTYLMTPEMISKFSNDFSLTFELLSIFSQSIIAAKQQKAPADDESLVEMIANISEVHTRLSELKETMHDQYAIIIINYLIDFCDICQQCYQSYSSLGEFDVELLQEILLRNIPGQHNSTTQNDSNAQTSPQMTETNQNLDMIEDLIDLGDEINQRQVQYQQNVSSTTQAQQVQYQQNMKYPNQTQQAQYQQNMAYPNQTQQGQYQQNMVYPNQTQQGQYQQNMAYTNQTQQAQFRSNMPSTSQNQSPNCGIPTNYHQ